MAATHPAYNLMKMPGSSGVITVACQEKDAVCSLERAIQAAAVESPEDEGGALPPEVAPKTKKQLLGWGSQEEAVPDSVASNLLSVDRAPSPIA